MDNRLKMKIALGIIVASYVVLTHEERKVKNAAMLAKKKEERVLLHQLFVWMCSQEAWSMSNEEFEREYKQRQEFIRLAISA